MSFLSSDSVSIITGASNGIGRGIAEYALKHHRSRVCMIDYDAVAGEKVAAEWRKTYGEDKIMLVVCDVTNEKELANAFRKCVGKWGRLDLCVNNAGIGDRVFIHDKETFTDEMPSNWKKTVEVNLNAVINGTRLAYHHMQANRSPKGGCIINVASLGGFIPQPYTPIYSATKHAVIGYSRSLSYLRKNGVRVNVLAPGFTDTNMVNGALKTNKLFNEVVTKATAATGGLVEVKDIVEGAFMLINDSSLAGAVLSVSYELGFSLHDFPAILPKDRKPAKAMSNTENESSKFHAPALPHKLVKQFPSKL